MAETRKCVKCHTSRPLIDFPVLTRDYGNAKKGEPKKECRHCDDKARQRRNEQSKTDKMGHIPGASHLPLIPASSLSTQLGNFRPSPRDAGVLWDLQFHVDISDTLAASLEDPDTNASKMRADSLAYQVFEEIGLRFVCNSITHHEDGDTTTVLYDCAQSEHNHRTHEKHKDPSKRRDKREIQHFPCRGALKLVIADFSDIAVLRFRHEVDHVKFEKVDVPEDVIELIHRSLDKTPAQLWKEVLKLHPAPKFYRHAVIHKWQVLTSGKYKSSTPGDTDWDSGIKLLDRATSDLGPYKIEKVKLQQCDGYRALAFCTSAKTETLQ